MPPDDGGPPRCCGLQPKIFRALLVIGLLFVVVVYCSRLPKSDPASVFYGLQAATLLILWSAVRVGSGVDFFRLAEDISQVAMRPSWMPSALFLAIVRSRYVYLSCAYALVPLLAATALRPDWAPLRLGTAVVSAIFQVGESSRTTSHRDYLMVYNCWSLVFLYGRKSAAGASYAQAVALALAVRFVLASGEAKLRVAGRAWPTAATMRAILRTFEQKRKEEGGPISPQLSRFVQERHALAGGLAAATLAFECVAAPCALLAPAAARVWLGWGMLLLHVGIALLQSGAIGAFFLPCAASYVFGLCTFGTGGLEVGSEGWLCAACVFGLLTLLGSVPEDWPLTPFALFPWSGAQWSALHDRLVLGDTRLVLCAEEAAPLPAALVGLPVAALEHKADPARPSGVAAAAAGAAAGGAPVAYDIWNRLIGVTTFQDGLLKALLACELRAMGGGAWDATEFTKCVEDWLLRTGRLLEVPSGRPLCRAFFVRVATSGAGRVVAEVLCEGSRPERAPLLGG